MTILEIKDEKGKLTEANKAVFEQADAEKRGMTAEENSSVASNLQRLDMLDLQLRNSTFEGNSTGTPVKDTFKVKAPKEAFSLIKAINDRVNQRGLSDAAKDVFTLGRNTFSRSGINPEGDFVLPIEMRADIVAGIATQGQEVVAEEKRTILPPLSDKLVFSQLGATYLTGLVGNVSIPTYSGTVVKWKSEVESADDGAGLFAEVLLAPKRITAYLHVSKTFLAQDGAGAEALLYSNIIGASARLIESTVLGAAAGSAIQPAGMGYILNAATVVVPTNAVMVAMEASIDGTNALQGNLAYVTNAGGRAILKSIDKGIDTGEMLAENNTVNGYPLVVTNSASDAAGATGDADLLVFGNWADLIIGQWGGYDITVDPYSRAKFNQVVIVINTYVDVKNARGTTGTGITLDSYATSFVAKAIKAE